MPMIWNAAADAKVLAAIIQVYDVKVSGEKLKEVAALVGPECTAKALTHRLSKLRSMAKEEEEGGGGGGDHQDDTTEKPKTATKATKANGATKKGKGKKAASERTPSPGEKVENYLTPPESTRAKRVGSKRNYAELAGETGSDLDQAEDGEDGWSKNVKIEVGEDIGEGLRQAADDSFT